MNDILFGNNNTAIIKKLSSRNFKANIKQNKIMIFSILLVTAMIFSVCSVGLSFVENLNSMNLHLKGTTANGLLTDSSDNQIGALKQLDYISSVGEQIYAGAIETEHKEQIALTYYDNTEWESHIRNTVDKVHGSLPQAENEIMLSEDALALLYISDPEIGMEIEVSMNQMSKKVFTLCGWYKDYVSVSRPGGGISGNVAAAALKGYQADANAIVAKSYAENHFIASLISFNVTNDVEDVVTRLQTDLSLPTTHAIILVDTQSEAGMESSYAVMGVVIVGIFIMLCGYLLIYNIAYISVTKDIHFYGVLKTLGTTYSQIRQLVRKQIFLFSGIAIPLGILLGSALSFAVVPICLKALLSSGGLAETMIYKASFHPLIYIAAVLFSFITVYISCRKPAKEAGKVSPIEAVRYIGVSSSVRKQYQGKRGTKLSAMAFRNVFQNKKRAVLVFLSLSVGLTIFVMVFTTFSHPDWNLKAKIDMPFDFTVNDKTISSMGESAQNQLDDDFLRELSSMKGIEEQEIVYGSICKIDTAESVWTQYVQDLADINSSEWDKIAQNALVEIDGISSSLLTKIALEVGSFDEKAISDFASGNTVYLAPTSLGNIQKDVIGSEISITDSFTGQTASYVVAGIFNENVTTEHIKNNQINYRTVDGVYTDDLSSNFANYSVGKIYMSEAGIGKLNSHPFIGQILLNVEPPMDSNINQQLKTALEDKTGVALLSQSESTQLYKESLGAILLIGTVFSFLLLFIGIINFVNTMTTTIYSRKHELTILESIGMTKKQILAMLSLEGCLYAVFSILLLLFIGLPATYLVLQLLRGQFYYLVFKVPVVMLVLIFALVIMICYVVPRLTYKQIAKNSISTRLRIAQ